MTVNRFIAPLFVAAGLVMAAAPAAQAADTAPPAPQTADTRLLIASDPAKLRVTQGIVTNLKLYELMVRVGQKTLAETPETASYTPDRKAALAQAFNDAMAKRRAGMIQKLAAGTRGDFSLEQLNNLTTLSKIKYVQDLIAQGADPSLVADAGTMTVAEQNLIQTLGNEAYVSTFFTQGLNFDVIKGDITDATLEAFAALKTPQQN